MVLLRARLCTGFDLVSMDALNGIVNARVAVVPLSSCALLHTYGLAFPRLQTNSPQAASSVDELQLSELCCKAKRPACRQFGRGDLLAYHASMVRAQRCCDASGEGASPWPGARRTHYAASSTDRGGHRSALRRRRISPESIHLQTGLRSCPGDSIRSYKNR